MILETKVSRNVREETSSATRLGYFWKKVLETNFLAKVDQIFGNVHGCFDKCNFLYKKLHFQLFGPLFETIGLPFIFKKQVSHTGYQNEM